MVKKMLKYRKIKNNGRNSTGQITVYHKGGGLTNNYRYIDTLRKLYNIPGIIKTIEYDPNRTGFISLINYNIFTINPNLISFNLIKNNNNNININIYKNINIKTYKIKTLGNIIKTYNKIELYKQYFNYFLFFHFYSFSTFNSFHLFSYILAPSNISPQHIIISKK